LSPIHRDWQIGRFQANTVSLSNVLAPESGTSIRDTHLAIMAKKAAACQDCIMGTPTFEEIRRRSRNGKLAVCQVIKGRSFQMRSSLSRGAAWMDFDMHCGNHDIKAEVSRSMAARYDSYCTLEQFRSTKYVTFTHKVFSLQVRLEHAEEWFAIAFGQLANISNLVRIRSSLLGEKRYRLTDKLLRTVGRVPDGEVVDVDPEAFTDFINDLTLDYEILRRMSPRDFERAIAAVYAKTGRFDRVILTPGSGDEGRDVILEAAEWDGRRTIVELKRYRRRRVSAEMVNSLIGVLTGELDGSRATFLTTSSFAPRLQKHRSIRQALSSRGLDLLDLVQLVEGCIQSEYCPDPVHFGTG
jgi:hypothetical protein